jgi:hypothetical protein
MSSTMGIASGMKGNEISKISGVFLFCPAVDVPASVTSSPSSSLSESGQYVMSSTWTSSHDREGIISSISVGLVSSSRLGFETPFSALNSALLLLGLRSGDLSQPALGY